MARIRNKEMEAQVRQAVAVRLLALRLVSGMTQSELARAIGTAQSAYQKWETGAGFPNPYNMLLLCARFTVDFNYLYLGRFEGVPSELAAKLAAVRPEIVPPAAHKGRGTGKRKA